MFVWKHLWTKCFNTQPPEGGWPKARMDDRGRKSFNTQPPEGGWFVFRRPFLFRNCFNTQPPEGGWKVLAMCLPVLLLFQHTAARRRLDR